MQINVDLVDALQSFELGKIWLLGGEGKSFNGLFSQVIKNSSNLTWFFHLIRVL